MKKNALLLMGAVILAVSPLIVHGLSTAPEVSAKEGAETEVFAGSDDQAKNLITQINPSYKPWYSSVWEPPSGEIASLLFAVQAAIGAGALFYYLGYIKGKNSVSGGDAHIDAKTT